MNRDEKGAVIAEIAAEITASETIFAVDYRGITVQGAAELRAKLKDADATFRVVKNSLTERAAADADRDQLKPLLVGPTALAFVRGDAALAAKAIADYGRLTQLLAFKGGVMGADALAPDEIIAISRLPSRQVLYGQMVGLVASPVSGLVRTLGALVGGLAIALGEVKRKKESGELPGASSPAVEAEVKDAGAEARESEPEAASSAEAESQARESEPEAASPAEAKSEPPASEQATESVPEAASEQAATGSETKTDTAAEAAEPETEPAATRQAQTDNDAEEAVAGEAAAAEATKED